MLLGGYLISLNVVWLLQYLQNFFSSMRLGVFRLFLEVVYLEIPLLLLSACGLFRHSHSRVMVMRAPLLLPIIKCHSCSYNIPSISRFHVKYQVFSQFLF